MIARQNPMALGIGRKLGALTRPWWSQLCALAVLVLVTAVLQLAPPLIVRSIVDDHLSVGTAEGLFVLAVLYLAATAGTQALVFGYTYLAAIVAQGVLNGLRVQLFAHYQQLPISYYDSTPIGD